ncbi:MAG TPA: chromosomal replication initiator DnaA [Sphingobium sp.]|uniref:chromosomal replication initiator DnaA n=1 Tax=unclassified Sphingobium TaxID=2611147 RepID=UPI0007F45E75|nr:MULTISPECIES: chromosomal replication initiator DnaA [unclassified Sphingobium]OAN51652.1 chromosomal replication initiator DnaA [Sphingobium sp. TCM1]WIW88620.1 chromosomal replication initiator DnaA [Sphingobium sp. V4]HAF43112.1 chromosomal replication initiator DnaA [Sphingobium sp.]
MSQISLPLEWHGGAGAGDFLVSDANRLAVAHLERWREWPLSVSVLTGPPLSGRSTLSGHFARMSGGEIIDDAQGRDEHYLFHAWNEAQTRRRPLLMVGDAPPASWTVALPDLRSRLAAAPHVAIEEPDEGLARALICRAFDLAGASYAPDLPDWLLRRVEHRYGAIAEVTRLLDRAALSSGRKISVAMAKETLQSAGFLPIVLPDPSTDQRE